jgi:outer membrane protein
MCKKTLLGVALTCLAFATQAQQKWTLRACVEYAVSNNISVKQADVQARLAAVTLKQSQLGRIPSVNANISPGFQSGQQISPDYTSFVTKTTYFTSLGLQGSATLFNFGAIRNNIKANEVDVARGNEQTRKVANDVSLQVANAYLTALLQNQQIAISNSQIQLTKAQLDNTRKRVAAGALPELNNAELEAQLSRDSTNLITAEVSYRQALLTLQALLALDAATPFAIDTPAVEKIPVDNIMETDPEAIYNVAANTQPSQKVNDLALKALGYRVKSSRGYLYPYLTINGTLASNFLFNPGQIQAVGDPVLYYPEIGSLAGNPSQKVISAMPSRIFTSYKSPGMFYQIDNNFRPSASISLNLPLFNGWTAKSNVQRAKLNYYNQQLTSQQGLLTLKNDIYNAYEQAKGSFQKYINAVKQVEQAQRTYDFATKRYDIGLLNTIDLIVNQNNLFQAKINKVTAQYDYVFRMKVLEYYKGLGLKL